MRLNAVACLSAARHLGLAGAGAGHAATFAPFRAVSHLQLGRQARRLDAPCNARAIAL